MQLIEAVLMMKRHYLYSLLVGLVMIIAFAISDIDEFLQPSVIAASTLPPIDWNARPIEVIPKAKNLNPEKVSLGRDLFQDKRLSRTNSISCLSCHDLSLGGTERRRSSVGMNGLTKGVNAPTVFNSGLNFKQFWDGRADSLEEQIEGPIHDSAEMGSSWPEVISKLSMVPEYRVRFGQLYSEISKASVADAIAVYERSLSTPNSRFDRYLSGDLKALNAEETEGYRRFKDSGCLSCHQGALLGGNLYQKFGIFGNYFKDRGNITPADYGRFNVTGQEEDRYVFKVPSLRNVEVTAPYFHDGSAETLSDAVKTMMKYELGRVAESQEVDLIIKFLTTLTGER